MKFIACNLLLKVESKMTKCDHYSSCAVDDAVKNMSSNGTQMINMWILSMKENQLKLTWEAY